MEHLIVDNTRSTALATTRAVAVLAAGGVLCAPTETVYGLMTAWDNGEGRERIIAMKHRPSDKHLQMLAASLAMAQRAGYHITPALRRIARAFWPGPLTCVGEARNGTTIGLRIPDHPMILSILRRLRTPLAATSANPSGEPPALTAATAVDRLYGQPDLLIDAGPVTGGQASTVIQILAGQRILLRNGPIPWGDIQQCLEQGPEPSL